MALRLLPETNLSPAEIKQKDDYIAGIALSEKKKAETPSDADVERCMHMLRNLQCEGERPWERAAALIKDGNPGRMSSVSLIFAF